MKPIGPKPTPRRFHQVSWDEPVIFELSQPGQRGILIPAVEPGIQAEAGDPVAALPGNLRREEPPRLDPEFTPKRKTGIGVIPIFL